MITQRVAHEITVGPAFGTFEETLNVAFDLFMPMMGL
jgi:hypothetical protein